MYHILSHEGNDEAGFSTGTEERDVPTTQKSGALSSRRCEKISSLECVLSFPYFHCQTNRSSQFALPLRPDDTIYIRLFSCHLSTTHRRWTGVLRHDILWYLQYLLVPRSRLTSM